MDNNKRIEKAAWAVRPFMVLVIVAAWKMAGLSESLSTPLQVGVLVCLFFAMKPASTLIAQGILGAADDDVENEKPAPVKEEPKPKPPPQPATQVRHEPVRQPPASAELVREEPAGFDELVDEICGKKARAK